MNESAHQESLSSLAKLLLDLNEVSTSDLPVVISLLIYLRWVDFLDAEQEATAAFEDSDFEPVLPNSLHWRTWHQLPPDRLHEFFRDQLGPVLQNLGGHHHNALAINLHRVGQTLELVLQLSKSALGSLVKWLESEPFETATDRRNLLASFDSTIEKFSDANFGEYRTPSAISSLVAALARPREGSRIYDPAFGTANLLTHWCDAYSYTQRTKTEPLVYTAPYISVSGVEINKNTFVIGLTRLSLAGIEDPHLEIGNSLERYPVGNFEKEGYDLIMVHPPFGMRLDRSRFNSFDYPIKSRDATSLFIQHALKNLRKDGRAIIVVPHGLLFGRSERDLRRWLLERYNVEAVIDLPKNAFAPLTSIRSSLLLISNSGPTTKVRMAETDQFFEDPHSKKEASFRNGMNFALGEFEDLPNNRQEDAFNELMDYAAGPKRSTLDVQNFFPSEIARAVFNIDTCSFTWDVDIKTLEAGEWDLTPRRREKSELNKILDELGAEVETVQLQEVSEIVSGRNIPSKQYIDQPLGHNPIPYIRIRDIQNGKVSRGTSWLLEEASDGIKSEWKLRAGDILLSKSGTIGKAGIVQNGAVGAVAASGNHVIRIDRDNIDPHFLLAYLDSNACRSWLQERASGSVISHLSIQIIRELPIPLLPLPMQQRVASQYKDHKTDAFLFLTKLLSQSESDPVAESIQLWLEKAVKIIRVVKGEENPIEADLESFDEIASEPAPIKNCSDCGKPYWLGTVDEQEGYSHPPYNYQDGFHDHCLSCWLGINEGSKSSPKFNGGGPLVKWSVSINNALKELSGIRKVPRGTSLLHLLQSSLVSIRDSEKEIKGHLPEEDKARKLTFGLVRNLESSIRQLVGNVQLEFEAQEESVEPGSITGIPLTIFNKGDFPLRDLYVSLRSDSDFSPPSSSTEAKEIAYKQLDLVDKSFLQNEFEYSKEWNYEKVIYFKENSTSTIILTVEAPEDLGAKMVKILWGAKTLSGNLVSGKYEFPLAVDRHKTNQIHQELGGSPYVCGDPVRPDRSDVFFGRENLIEQIRRQVSESGNVVLLEGNRRAGKTSILKHLEGSEIIEGWLGVYCSLQGAEGSQDGVGVPTVEVFREIAKSMAKGVRACGIETPLPDGSVISPDKPPLGIAKACRAGISQDSAFSDFQEYAEVILHLLLEKELGVLLMLDEFDKLQEGIDNGVTSPQVPENIRFLVQNNPRFSAILTGSRRLKRLREEYWHALFGLGSRFSVTSLSKDAARRLVTEPVSEKISYSNEAVDRAIYLTASQPYLLQCLCNRIFDRVAQGNTRTVTVDIVNAAGKDLVQNNEHFASLWAYAGSHRCRFILAICNVEGVDRDPYRLGELSEILASHGIEVHDDTLISDIDFLRELELVDLVTEGSDGRYQLSIPLMGQWIRTEQDFDAIKKQAQYETEDENV